MRAADRRVRTRAAARDRLRRGAPIVSHPVAAEGPSPQAAEPVAVAADAHEVRYTSGALRLRAWVSNTSGAPKPAIVYVHGASAFRADHWEATRPLRDAGFVVMTPILRSENGSPGG